MTARGKRSASGRRDSKMPFDIAGKVAFVTGASGGIGGAVASSFFDQGVKLMLLGRSDTLDNVLPDAGEQVLRAKGDINDDAYLDEAIRATTERWGRIDILVNSAGMNIRRKIDGYTSDEWDAILDTNLKSIFSVSNKVAAVMKEQRSGKIINVSSIQGVICWDGMGTFSLAPYCASKAALISLTKSFALALASYSINVNAVCPGVVNGKWAENLKNDPALYKDILSRTPLHRLIEHSDLTGPITLLASDEGNGITGHALMVDGGWTIQ